MTTVSTYEQAAIEFLEQTGTTFMSEFVRFGEYFDESQKRNIFKITLKNAVHKYSFEFGASLNDSLKNSKDVIYDTHIDIYCGLKFEGLKVQYLSYSDKLSIKQVKEACLSNATRHLMNKAKATEIYTEFIKANTNKHVRLNILPLSEWLSKVEGAVIRKASELQMKNFGEGLQSETIVHPTSYDVLSCLTKYEVGTFDNFCSEFGYDTDSRKAYKTYKAVLREWKNVEKLWTPEQIELLQEIN